MNSEREKIGVASDSVRYNCLMDKVAGIYEIVNTVNGHRYVGSAVNIQKRWKEHKNLLLCGKHHSLHLQNAWNKYGMDCFIFGLIEQCEESLLIQREQCSLDSLHPEYNIAKVAGSSLGIKRRPESIEKTAAAHRGKPGPRRGCVLSEEIRAKMSTAKKGHKASEETKAKMRASSRHTGCTDEHYAKLSVLFTGKPLSEEHKKKLSIAHMGNTSALGHKVSDEVKAILSTATKLHYQRLKEGT